MRRRKQMRNEMREDREKMRRILNFTLFARGGTKKRNKKDKM